METRGATVLVGPALGLADGSSPAARRLQNLLTYTRRRYQSGDH